MKKILILGIAVLILSMAFVGCDDKGGVTFSITNNHTVDIKSVRVQDTFNNEFTKNISISANGGTGKVSLNLKKSMIGYGIAQFEVTFTDNAKVYPSSFGFTDKTTVNVTVTGSDVTLGL